MLSADDVRVLDLNSAWHGVPPSRLMQNAGRAVADVALRRFSPKRILVLAGHGNNGGDGAVAARHLAEAGASVTVLYSTDPQRLPPGDARGAFETLDRRRIRIETYRGVARTRELLVGADLVVDALLGVGATGELREPIQGLAKAANASRRPILSIDVPTGLGARLQIRPHTTVTLHDRKPGLTRAAAGSVLVRDIGIPEAAHGVGPGDLAVHYPRNAAASHKGQNGRVLAVCGGPYCGAPLLSALGALRAGADLVRLYTPEECAEAAMAHAPDLIVQAGAHDHRLVAADVGRIAPWLEKVDAVLLGPGLGLHGETRAAVRDLLAATQRLRLPLVLDADALPVAGQHPALLRRRPVLATPHHREFRDLARRALPRRDDARARAAEREARRLRITILLKGSPDVVTDGHRTKENRIHHPWMTAGGTGDVLAGLAVALVAKGLEPFRAACAAAFLGGAAGLRAFEETSWGSRASDLIRHVPSILRDWVPKDPAR